MIQEETEKKWVIITHTKKKKEREKMRRNIGSDEKKMDSIKCIHNYGEGK